MTAAVSTTTWWVIGWAIGAAVVVVAALLLLASIALARRIVRQTGEIAEALDGARARTGALADLAKTNLALERVIDRLREGEPEAR